MLDVGCGRGGTAALIAERFDADVTGVDLSPEAIAFCRRMHDSPRMRFEVGDAEHVPVDDRAFDVVTNVESSHTYPNLRAFFAEVSRVLVSGGVFLYTDLLPGAALDGSARAAGPARLHDHGRPAHHAERAGVVRSGGGDAGAGVRRQQRDDRQLPRRAGLGRLRTDAFRRVGVSDSARASEMTAWAYLLQFKEVDKPAPKDNEVLIAIHATTVSTGDCNVRNFTFVTKSMLPIAKLMFGIGKPWKERVLGTELAGEVEGAGKDVKRFKKGDRVVASTGMAGGGHAQYACLPEKGAMVIKPNSLSWEEAVAIPFGANTALYFLRPGEDPGRAGTSDHRSFGEHRLGWSTAGETLWGDRDRGMQRRER